MLLSNPNAMKLTLDQLLFCTLAGLCLSSGAQAHANLSALLDETSLDTKPQEEVATKVAEIADAECSASSKQLLELAFEAASAFPTVPHIKNRCRAQFEIVETCFEIDLPNQALTYTESIDDWRKGIGLAQFAAHCARRGESSDRVRDCLERATKVADGEGVEKEDGQDWRRDRVLAKVKLGRYLLDGMDRKAQLSEAVMHADESKLELLLARSGGEEGLEEELLELFPSANSGDFEETQAMVQVLVEFSDRVYRDEARRQSIEKRIRESWSKLPLAVRMDALLDLADSAAAHSDMGEFERFRLEGKAMLEEHRWLADTRVPLMARWAEKRFLAGDKKEATADLVSALMIFSDEREEIANINRADALRPVAEAYHAMGMNEAARKIYARAIDESLMNPNSRPRADDLVATCCSMVRVGFEPDEAMWAELREVRKNLKDPW